MIKLAQALDFSQVHTFLPRIEFSFHLLYGNLESEITLDFLVRSRLIHHDEDAGIMA